MDLRKKVIKYHNQRIAKYQESKRKWNTLKAQLVGKYGISEWNRINKGIDSDIQEAIDYTNNFLKSKGLDSLPSSPPVSNSIPVTFPTN